MPPGDGSGDASTTQTGNIIPPNISITNLQGNVNITNIQGIIPGLPNVQVILKMYMFNYNYQIKQNNFFFY